MHPNELHPRMTPELLNACSTYFIVNALDDALADPSLLDDMPTRIAYLQAMRTLAANMMPEPGSSLDVAMRAVQHISPAFTWAKRKRDV